MSISVDSGFTANERQEILYEVSQKYKWRVETSLILYRQNQKQTVSNAELSDIKRQYLNNQECIWNLIKIYVSKIPIIPLSRCPYCQAINYYSFDHYNLDGLWWSNLDGWMAYGSGGCRPRKRHHLCPHFWALSGAVHIGSKIPQTPFPVTPGPEVPFVLTHVLQASPVRVVVSQLQVGEYIAYPVVYFSNVKPLELEPNLRFREWANCYAVFHQEDEHLDIFDEGLYLPLKESKHCSLSLSSANNFDLASWIQQDQVFWIAPDDKTLTLQQNLEACPFINLPGRRERLFIELGKVRTA